MIIYGYIKKSKPKLKPKAEREEYEAWLRKHNVNAKTKSKPFKKLKGYSLSIPEDRNPRKYASVDSGVGNATKQEIKQYTGDKMMGIATMHKSNAVPVFNNEEAVQISSMRR